MSAETLNLSYDVMNSLNPEFDGISKKEFKWATKYVSKQVDFKLIRMKLAKGERLSLSDEAVRRQMIFDPRIVAERKRIEPIYFFIHKFIVENNHELQNLTPGLKRFFWNFDKDKDKLLNREEFLCFLRHWAKFGFCWNLDNPGIV